MENDTLYNIEDIVAENRRRLAVLDHDPYDPMTGEGCWGDRIEVGDCRVPAAVLARHPDYLSLDEVARDRARIQEDFEFWCVRCTVIKDKLTGQNISFVPNRPQRRLLALMEEQRVAGQPVRVILLKARQWGGSTLVQLYMAWMQLVRHTGWNSLICGHLHITSKSIKRMYNLLLRHYPKELLDDDAEPPCFTKLEGQPNVQQITSRDCLVLTGSSRSEDAVRGYDISMAHLSEVAFWKSSAMHNPDEVVRSVCGSVALKPDTVIVLESTAKGVGDYFHDEWLRAQMGSSDKAPLFVPWNEIEIYRREVDDVQALWNAMDDYERWLWDKGCTLEQINWYHCKRKECHSQAMMMSEYPTTPTEAFTTTGSHPFEAEHLDRLEQNCLPVPLVTGDIQADGLRGSDAKVNVHLVSASNGLLKVWELPEKGAAVKTRYMVVVDVGGRSMNSDYSVIAVWRLSDGTRRAAIVAQWRGHIDHDLLAWKAMQLAVFYNNAMLVVESNTLTNEAACAGESDYILSTVHDVYDNVYQRAPYKYGFHTNVKTKGQAITALVAAVRDGRYLERDQDAVNEMRQYQDHGGGRYGAPPGKHDDLLMTRAIGILLMDKKLIDGKTPSPDPSLAENQWGKSMYI